jgi:NAD(P)-dependent dehydrogenase (short-subunit alcohol dehydrogenase family)
VGRLDGKVAVITGAASGIGAESARFFVAEGARVVICDIKVDEGKGLAAQFGDAAMFRHCDVTREDEVATAIDAAVREFGRLDVMFSNAGVLGTVGPISEIPAEEFDATIAVLLRSVFFGMKHAARVMGPQGTGSIISTASGAGLEAGWGPHVYSAAKAAVIHLTRSVAIELGERGIRVNCICPGGIVTNITQSLPGSPPVPAEAVRKAMAGMQPIHRAGEPLDIAQAALWLASDESTFVTGAAIVVDGGMTLGMQWPRQAQAFRQRPS